MKAFLIIFLSFSLSTTVFGQADSGYTNKYEAKNQTVYGLKDGKWIENVPRSQGNYILIIYKAGKACGIVRQFFPDGRLYLESTYVNGQKNGLEKRYNRCGQLQAETPFVNDQMNGTERRYFASEDYTTIEYMNGTKKEVTEDSLNGTLVAETPYVNGKINGVEKRFYPNGKVEFETIYTNGVQGKTKGFKNE